MHSYICRVYHAHLRGGAMTQESGSRVQRSVYFDRDVLEWLRRRGERLDRSVDYQVREILRAAMDAEMRDIEDTVQG